MAETGLTRTAFYRHFDDVTDLVLRLLSRSRAATSMPWPSAGSRAPAPAIRPRPSRGWLRWSTSSSATDRCVRAVTEAAASDERIEHAYRATLEALIEITAGGIDHVVAEGQLEAVPDSRALARALNLMNETYLLQEFGREPYGDPQVALATLETVWLGVLRPIGYSEDSA